MRRSMAAVVAAGLSAITVVGCSLAGSSAPSTAPSAADAALVDEGVEASLESAIANFLGGVNPPIQTANRVGTPATAPLLRLAHVPFDLVRSTRMHRVRTGTTTRGGLPSCITLVPAIPADDDSDGIPDTVSMTAGANCTFTQDSLTFSISGSLTEGDPTPTTPDADYMAAANNLVISLSSGADSSSIGLNGGATVTETAGSLSQSNQNDALAGPYRHRHSQRVVRAELDGHVFLQRQRAPWQRIAPAGHAQHYRHDELRRQRQVLRVGDLDADGADLRPHVRHGIAAHRRRPAGFLQRPQGVRVHHDHVERLSGPDCEFCGRAVKG